MWISGAGTFGGSSSSINGISNVNTSNSTLSLGNSVGFFGSSAEGLKLYYSGSTGNSFLDSYYSNGKIYFRTNVSSGTPVNALIINNVGAATFNSSVTASSFSGNGSNLTGIQLPITLTTNGTSGAATFSGNVLNVPNYSSVFASGEFQSNPTAVSNVSSVVVSAAYMTRIGNIYTISIRGEATTTSTSACIVSFDSPSATTVGSKNIIVATAVRADSSTSPVTCQTPTANNGKILVTFRPPTEGAISFNITGQVAMPL